MNNFVLTAIIFVVALRSKALSSIIPGYEISEDEANIQNNLIGYENEAIEGLYPPKRTAGDYYRTEPETSTPKPETEYIVEINRNSVKFQTSGFPAQRIKLSDKESEGIQRLSLALVELLDRSKLSSKENGGEGQDWRKLNPVITLSGSDISVQFTSKPPEGTDDLESNNNQDKHIFWEFMTSYANNIFEEKVKGLDIPDTQDVELPFPVDDSKAFRKFLTTMWKIMMASVQHAESTFAGWTTTTVAPPPERDTRSTIATLFAYEEPSLGHAFPSEEFEKRRRDVDSIFYGRGII